MKASLEPRRLCLLALMAALMLASQIALAALPNIHLVALLIILTTLCFGYRALFSVAVFVLAEGLFYGFGIWWISYVYVWPLLVFAVLAFRRTESPLFWAIVAGLHGLFFGAMCALPYLFVGGWAAALSYWVAGIPFDLLHCAGNFAVTLLLLKPLLRLMKNSLASDDKQPRYRRQAASLQTKNSTTAESAAENKIA